MENFCWGIASVTACTKLLHSDAIKVKLSKQSERERKGEKERERVLRPARSLLFNTFNEPNKDRSLSTTKGTKRFRCQAKKIKRIPRIVDQSAIISIISMISQKKEKRRRRNPLFVCTCTLVLRSLMKGVWDPFATVAIT